MFMVWVWVQIRRKMLVSVSHTLCHFHVYAKPTEEKKKKKNKPMNLSDIVPNGDHCTTARRWNQKQNGKTTQKKSAKRHRETK
jgi:hypothetical protein